MSSSTNIHGNEIQFEDVGDLGMSTVVARLSGPGSNHGVVFFIDYDKIIRSAEALEKAAANLREAAELVDRLAAAQTQPPTFPRDGDQ